MKDRQKEAAYAARTIRTFLDGGGRDHDWDDFTSCSLRDADLDRLRRRAGAVDLPLGQEERAALLALADEADRLAVSNIEPRKERRSLGWWTRLLLFASMGFAIAIAFKKSDALVLVWLVYASGAAFLGSAFLMIVAIERWPRNGSLTTKVGHLKSPAASAPPCPSP